MIYYFVMIQQHVVQDSVQIGSIQYSVHFKEKLKPANSQ